MANYRRAREGGLKGGWTIWTVVIGVTSGELVITNGGDSHGVLEREVDREEKDECLL